MFHVNLETWILFSLDFKPSRVLFFPMIVDLYNYYIILLKQLFAISCRHLAITNYNKTCHWFKQEVNKTN